MSNGVPVPSELFVAETAARAGTLYPVPAPASGRPPGPGGADLVVASGYQKNPYHALTQARATLLRGTNQARSVPWV
ncbi:MAG: hypothetical protein ACRDOH_11940 [Streptosporangiaceae bacterium]